MDERLRFMARLLEGEEMMLTCREFGISRVTGHKTFNSYKECGLDALYDRSHRHCSRFQSESRLSTSSMDTAPWTGLCVWSPISAKPIERYKAMAARMEGSVSSRTVA